MSSFNVFLAVHSTQWQYLSNFQGFVRSLDRNYYEEEVRLKFSFLSRYAFPVSEEALR